MRLSTALTLPTLILQQPRALKIKMAPRLSLRLMAAALLVSVLAALPLFYISLRAVAAGPDTWLRLWSGQIPGLLLNTVLLLAATILFTVGVGVSAAWLVERTDLPGRRVWRWLLALPLAVPAYVAALSYMILLRRGGLLEQAAIHWMGFERGQLPLPSLYNLAGATVIIGLCVFPYVYLTVGAALRSSDRTLEEAARAAGRTPWGVFRDVTLPLIWPAVAAGALLVGLYVLSDFGTVGILRYRTFTTAIYNQFTGQIDRSGAAILSFVLVGLTLPLLMAENWFNRRKRRYIRNSAWQPRRPAPLGRWRWAALALVGLLAGVSLGLPLAVLGGLTLQGLFFPTEVDRIWSVNNESLWQYGFNSLMVAVLAATLAMVLAFAPTYLAARYPLRLPRLLLNVSKTAFALPGLIVGLSLVMMFNQWLPLVYGTVIALVLGFTFRLLPQSLATGESSWQRVSPTLEQAARVMGCRSLTAFRRVTLPLAAPGLLAGWALIFIAAMKELPTAILLRPPGFDTLPVRIWAAASESVYTQAAPPAFLLVLLTMLVLALLYGRGGFGLDRVLSEQK